MRTVVALGGNAIADEGEPTVRGQREQVADTANHVAALTDCGHEVVLTHGNGPQVGQLLEQQAAADLPERPLDVLVAETQAQVGYLVASQLEGRLDGGVTALVTRVRVDPDDTRFDEATKPVGPYLSEREAAGKPYETAAVTTPEGERAYRRVVPSPRPTAVLEAGAIRALVERGMTVICGGGGGVPVVDGGDGSEAGTGDAPTSGGIKAVVDKDYTSGLVAEAVDASCLVMATNVDCAYRDFGTDGQHPIGEVDAATMRDLLADGQFSAGSMRPKVEACLGYLDAGGDRAVVTAIDRIEAGVDGDAGTQITPAEGN